MNRIIWTFCACGLAAACSSTGRLPRSVVDLYDMGKHDGWMEIEAERNGTILGMETDIEVARLPAPVLDAARQQLPGGSVTGAEYERTGNQASYEVKMRKGGRDYEFIFTPAGQLLESEKELMRNEAPRGVVEAAMRSLPGASFKSVEIITQGSDTTYHVKLAKGGASYKFVVAPDGQVVRKVREAKTEIEIPLQ